MLLDFEQLLHNYCNVMDCMYCMYKGADMQEGSGMGGEDRWAAGDRLYLLNLLVISPDKPRGPKRHVTNAG